MFYLAVWTVGEDERGHGMHPGSISPARESALAADDTGPKRRGRPFKPGRSGNPSGRPKGARNTVTLMLEALLDGEAEGIARKAIELAKAGDSRALKACFDRLLPAHHGRPVTFRLPDIKTAADLPKASAALLSAAADGELTPSEACELARLVDVHVRALELTDINERLARLEENLR
jgi:hypothetical protein